MESREHREHLNYMCRKALGKLKTWQEKKTGVRGKVRCTEELTAEEEKRRSELLLSEIADQPQVLQDVLSAFLFSRFPATLHRALVPLLLMMAADAALSSVLPFRSHPLIRQIVTSLRSREEVNASLQKLKEYCPELTTIFVVAEVDGCLDIMCAFVCFLLDRILYIHAENRTTDPPLPIPGSYNPPSGVAYYFTEEGHQVRKMGKYNIAGGTLKDKNHDDPPQILEKCNKQYPLVSRGGYGYMFLWFCPLHGHCYGLHLINGSEGRIDPFSSLLKYLPEAPKEVFYDFACSLSEYSLNREPEFFKETRFFHDIFHSFPHKCGQNFRSARLLGLDGVNTEICEQWNSFLQCIKFTASHLSQCHMMFFVQFMIAQFNKLKTRRFRAKAQVAVAGLL